MAMIHGMKTFLCTCKRHIDKYINISYNFRLIEFEACESLAREIMEQLTLRDREPRTSQAFASLSARIRIRLKQYNNQVRELRSKVNEACRQHSMYP